MKNTPLRFAPLVAALALLNAALLPSSARAQDQSREDAVALLTSGMWHFEGSNWSNDRVFEKKGTVLVRASNARGVIKWKIDSKKVTISFPDHDDEIYLPIDPKGSKGVDGHGKDVVVTQIAGSATGQAGPPSALDALKSNTVASGGTSQGDTTSVLISKKWLFAGASWNETRVFNFDGTMSIEGSDRVAKWQVTSDRIVMTFKDHKDILFLPLDPKGTKGQDEYNRLFIATQVTASAATPTPAPAAATSGTSPAAPANPGSYFGTSHDGGATAPPPPPGQ